VVGPEEAEICLELKEDMKPRILLIHIGGLENIGCLMMLQAVLKYIDADFFYHKSTYCRGYEAHGLKGSWKLSGYSLAISLGGDAFTVYAGWWQFIRLSVRFFLMIVLKQRYILLAQTFCNYGILTPIAKLILRHATAISVRDDQSQALLTSYGILGYFTADLAWSLSPNELPAMKMRENSFHSRVWSIIKGISFPYPLQHPSRNWKYSIFEKPLQVALLQERSMENFALVREALSKH